MLLIVTVLKLLFPSLESVIFQHKYPSSPLVSSLLRALYFEVPLSVKLTMAEKALLSSFSVFKNADTSEANSGSLYWSSVTAEPDIQDQYRRYLLQDRIRLGRRLRVNTDCVQRPVRQIHRIPDRV